MDLSKKRSSKYVTGIYASFIIIFAFTLSLFYTSRCQKSPHLAKQDADILEPQNSADSLQIVVKKLDINKGQSENKNEAANSDNEVNDENIRALQSILGHSSLLTTDMYLNYSGARVIEDFQKIWTNEEQELAPRRF